MLIFIVTVTVAIRKIVCLWNWGRQWAHSECRVVVESCWLWKTEGLGEKPVPLPVPLCSPQVTRGLPWARTRPADKPPEPRCSRLQSSLRISEFRDFNLGSGTV